MAFKKLAQVRQIVTPIQGEVVDKRFNQDGDCLEYLVAYKGADGEMHERWFLESELSEVQ